MKKKSTDLTSIKLQEALDQFMEKVASVQEINPTLIIAAWPPLVGERIAKMTKAVSFTDQVLTVKVSNSTLYSLLNLHEKGKLLQKLRELFPKVEIKNIAFRIG